jgi:hypothetical protein
VGKQKEKSIVTFEKPTRGEYFEYLLEKAKAQEKANLAAN